MFKFDRHYIAETAFTITLVLACLILLVLGHIFYLFRFPFYVIKCLRKGKRPSLSEGFGWEFDTNRQCSC